MSQITRHAFGLAAAALGGLAPAAVMARQADAVDNVVVTASRRETRLLETPMSVTVIDQEALRATHVDNFANFAKLTPGLTFADSGPGNKRYALRGLQSAGEPEVALYYDEIPIAGIGGGSLDTGDSQPDLKLWDVDRVEVLRGPQGTLYGNGAMGGAIRILSRRPQLDRYAAALETSAATTDGGDPSRRANAMVNVPLVQDRLAVRLTGYVRREGGWIDDRPWAGTALPQIGVDNLNWEHTWGGRASVSLQATSRWNLTAIGYYQGLHTGNTADLYPAYAAAGDRFVSKAYVRTPWRDRSRMVNLISSYDGEDAQWLTTAAYQRRTVTRYVDTTRYILSLSGCTEATWNRTCFTPPIAPTAGPSHDTVDSWSAETRLISTTPGPWQWTLGANLQDTATARLGLVARVNADGYVRYGDDDQLLDRLFARDNHDTFDQRAVFGEGSYALTERLTAIAGLRWFHSDRTDQQIIYQQFFAGQPTGALPFQEFKQGKVFKKAELTYRLGGEGLVYVQAAQGFRSGGPNYPGGFSASAPPYAADSVWDYEVGWKVSLADRRLYWSGALFRINWNNLQQLVPTANFNYIANAGAARSDGFETEVAWRPSATIRLTGGATYNDARLVGAQPIQTNPNIQLKAGDKLANVPDWTLTASAAYRRALSARLTASARLDAVYQSSRANLVTRLNPGYFVIGEAKLVDLHLALESRSGWRLGFDVENLFNGYEPLSGKSQDANLARTVAAARPRTAGLSLSVDY